MGWLDIVLLAVVAVAGLGGLRLGLIRAVFVIAGMLIGWLVAGQLSDDIGAAVGGSSTTLDTVVTTVSYSVIVSACGAAAAFAVKIVRPLMALLTMGLSSMVDRIGGLVVGLLLGVAVAAAIVVAAARLTYDFDAGALTDRAPGEVADRLPEVEGVREGLEESLNGSRIAGYVVDAARALPAGALGLAPADFAVALDILKQKSD